MKVYFNKKRGCMRKYSPFASFSLGNKERRKTYSQSIKSLFFLLLLITITH